VCVLGYCLLPPALALLTCKAILIMQQTTLLFILRLVATAMGFVWATYGKLLSIDHIYRCTYIPIPYIPVYSLLNIDTTVYMVNCWILLQVLDEGSLGSTAQIFY
jgi:hypothetical protein